MFFYTSLIPGGTNVNNLGSTANRWAEIQGVEAEISGRQSIGSVSVNNLPASGINAGRLFNVFQSGNQSQYSYLSGLVSGTGVGEGPSAIVGAYSNNCLFNWALRGGQVTVSKTGGLTIVSGQDNCFQPTYGIARNRIWTQLNNTDGVTNDIVYEFVDTTGTLIGHHTALAYVGPFIQFGNLGAKVANVKVETRDSSGVWTVQANGVPTFAAEAFWRGNSIQSSTSVIYGVRFTVTLAAGITDLRILELGWATQMNVLGGHNFGMLNSANIWGQPQTWKSDTLKFASFISKDILSTTSTGNLVGKTFAEVQMVTGSGTANVLPIWTGTGNALGNSLVSQSGLNLTYQSTGQAVFSVYSTAASATIRFGASSPDWLFTRTASGDFNFQRAGGTNVWTVAAGSNVSVFTARPLVNTLPVVTLDRATPYSQFYLPRFDANGIDLEQSAFADDGFTLSLLRYSRVYVGGTIPADNTLFDLETDNAQPSGIGFRVTGSREMRWKLGVTAGDPGDFALVSYNTSGVVTGTVFTTNGFSGTTTFQTAIKMDPYRLTAGALTSLNDATCEWLRFENGGWIGPEQVGNPGGDTIMKLFGWGNFEVVRLSSHASLALICPETGQGGFVACKRGVTSPTPYQQAQFNCEQPTYPALSGPDYSVATISFGAIPVGPSGLTNPRLFSVANTEDVRMSRASNGNELLPDNSDRGFFFINSMAGKPSVTPIYGVGGTTALVYSRSDASLYAFDGALPWKRIGPGIFGGSGTIYTLPRWGTGGTILVDSAVTDDGTNVFTGRVTGINNLHQVRGYNRTKNSSDANNHYYKIATLLASGAGQGTCLEVDFIGGGYQAVHKNTIKLMIGNRDSFRATAHISGTYRQAYSGIKAFQESDNTVSIYLYMQGGQFAAFTADYRKGDHSDNGTTLYPNPSLTTTTGTLLPSGTLLYDSTDDTPIAPQTSCVSPSGSPAIEDSVFTHYGNTLSSARLVATGVRFGTTTPTLTSMLRVGPAFVSGTSASWINQGLRINGGLFMHGPGDPDTPSPKPGANFTAEGAGGLALNFSNGMTAVFRCVGMLRSNDLTLDNQKGKAYLATDSDGKIFGTTAPGGGISGSGTDTWIPRFKSGGTALEDSAIRDATNDVVSSKNFWVAKYTGGDADFNVSTGPSTAGNWKFFRNNGNAVSPAAKARWVFRMEGGADLPSGTNGTTGANLTIRRYDDGNTAATGSEVGDPVVEFFRSADRTVKFYGPVRTNLISKASLATNADGDIIAGSASTGGISGTPLTIGLFGPGGVTMENSRIRQSAAGNIISNADIYILKTVPVGSPTLFLNTPSGASYYGSLIFSRGDANNVGGANRWAWIMDAGTDLPTTTGNSFTGANLRLRRYRDDGNGQDGVSGGGAVDDILDVNRSTRIVDFKVNPTLLGVKLNSGEGTGQYFTKYNGTGAGIATITQSSVYEDVPNKFVQADETFRWFLGYLVRAKATTATSCLLQASSISGQASLVQLLTGTEERWDIGKLNNAAGGATEAAAVGGHFGIVRYPNGGSVGGSILAFKLDRITGEATVTEKLTAKNLRASALTQTVSGEALGTTSDGTLTKITINTGSGNLRATTAVANKVIKFKSPASTSDPLSVEAGLLTDNGNTLSATGDLNITGNISASAKVSGANLQASSLIDVAVLGTDGFGNLKDNSVAIPGNRMLWTVLASGNNSAVGVFFNNFWAFQPLSGTSGTDQQDLMILDFKPISWRITVTQFAANMASGGSYSGDPTTEVYVSFQISHDPSFPPTSATVQKDCRIVFDSNRPQATGVFTNSGSALSSLVGSGPFYVRAGTRLVTSVQFPFLNLKSFLITFT